MNELRDVLDKQEETKKQFIKTQAEKGFYLGEYKERVIAALQKDQVEEDDVYPEILEAMKGKEAYILKMSRELSIKKLKPYMKKAEEFGIKYQLVDGLSYSGNIGLVVAAKDALRNPPEAIVIRDMDQDFIDAGLGEIYSKNRGKRICKPHYVKLEETLPEYKNAFKRFNIFDKIIGRECPICRAEKNLGGKQKHGRI